MAHNDHTFYEFFAGGGMARAGLGEGWTCTFANDFSPAKEAAYRANWGDDDFILGDIANVSTAQLLGCASLAWASFPCQDLSLAGSYAGLGENGADVPTRSGTFWHFWTLIKGLKREGRAPKTIVLENVTGALTSRGGADFAAIGSALAEAGYLYGAVVIDAALFVPQSRPRVFFIATLIDVPFLSTLTTAAPTSWHPAGLRRAHAQLRGRASERWVWWRLPEAPKRATQLADMVEEVPADVAWHTDAETARLLWMMSEGNRQKVAEASQSGSRKVGTIYRRTRPDENGIKHQRAEVRFDGLAGCLRTPGGGSSRQTIMVVEGEKVRTRLLSVREAARLMGLPDSYIMPTRYNEAYHLAGDGVCVDVVRFLAKSLLEPLNSAPALTITERRSKLSMAIDLGYRRKQVRTLTNKVGCYVLCDLDQVPLYVGQSKDGIRARVNRHLTSARSDIIANRQVDVWEIAWVWAYPVEALSDITPLETALFHAFHPKSALMNGKVPPSPAAGVQSIPDPFQIVQVMSDSEILEKADPALRLPRQAEHYSQIVGHFLAVKNSKEIAGAIEAHYQRLSKYHRQLLGLAQDVEGDTES